MKTQSKTQALAQCLENVLLGEKIPLDITNYQSGEVLVPAGRKITKTMLKQVAQQIAFAEMDPSPLRNRFRQIVADFAFRWEREHPSEDEAPRQTYKEFKVVAVSTNCNSFGLRGVKLIAPDREAWEIAMNDLNIETHRITRGRILKVPYANEPTWAGLGAEIPRRLEPAPHSVTKLVWTKPVEAW